MSSGSPGIVIFDREMIEEKAYWNARLRPNSEFSSLRLDHPRPSSYAETVDSLPIRIAGELYDQLIKLTNGKPLLLYATLMAGLRICLYRCTGVNPVSVGSPARRYDEATPQQENALAIGDDLDGDLSFRQYLLHVRELLVEAYARQRYPYTYLIKDLHMQDIRNKCPLFDIALALTDFHLPLPAVKNDITITFTPEPDQLHGRIAYSRQLFDESSIHRLARIYLQVLEQALENTDIRLRDISTTTDAERRQMLVEWNETAAEYPRAICVHQLIAAQAARAPEAPAIVDGPQRLTYQELDARADVLAQHLRALGVGPETRVGVCMERSPELVVGLLGVLKAGGAYVPMDPEYPAERLAFMVEDAQVVALLTQERLLERLPREGRPVFCLDTGWDEIVEQSHIAPAPAIGVAGADNIAYVIYTSGSTGWPKGVAVAHHSLMNLIQWHVHTYALSPDDRATLLAGVAFDASTWEIWPYLAAGASINIPDLETLASPGRLWEWLAARSITRCFMPTPLAETMLHVQCPPGLALKSLLTGGDRLHHAPEHAEPFGFINHYGPTESTVVTTATVVEPALVSDVPPPIGHPIANTQVYVLDQWLQPVPVGFPGDLYIGGEGLARGYLNRPELTAERFIPHPLSSTPGTRLYHTGDVVRFLPDGNLDFLGRADDQVKVRGYRIELGEIEAVLTRLPGVLEASVIVREDIPGDQRLVAYVVLDQAPAPALPELRQAIQEVLPDFMVPSAIVPLEALPLTPNGKVDRRALPIPDASRPELASAYVAPSTPVEEVLAELWAGVLGVEKVGIRDDFFELGGHSLLATRVLAQMRDVFPVELALRTFFEAPTVQAVAAALIRQEAQPGQIEAIARLRKQLANMPADEVHALLQIKRQVKV